MKATSVSAVLRISRRNIGRHRWRSALVVLLVLLPVAGMVGGLTYLRTTIPTAEERATAAMGRADALVYPNRSGASAERLATVLPPGTRVDQITTREGQLEAPGRRLRVVIRSLDLGGLAQGILRVVEGRPPASPTEIALSRSLAAVTQRGLGDQVRLAEGGERTIVGIVENPARLSQRVVLEPPGAVSEEAEPAWLIELPPGAELPAEAFEEPTDGVVVVAPAGNTMADFIFQTREQWMADSSGPTAGTVVIGSLVLVETILIASAAFAVSIRRRQRELGVMAAAGAQPRHLAGTVLGEGLVLGGLGGLLGAAIGVLAVVAASPALDQLTDRRNPAVVVDGPAILLCAGVGLLAVLVAAAVPAWSAARLPVLSALSGRRPPASPAHRLLLGGVALVALSVLLTAGGAGTLLASRNPGDSNLGLIMLVLGAVIGVLGFGTCSPWLIERLDRLGRRLPVAGRIAFRDTARARSRSAPIATAMLAGLAATIAIGAFVTSYFRLTESQWQPWARPDQLLISGADAAEAGPMAAREMGAVASAPMPWLYQAADGGIRLVSFHYSRSGDAPPVVLDEYGSWTCEDCGSAEKITLGTPELLAALGAEEAAASLEAGLPVILTRDHVAVREVTVVISQGDRTETLTMPAVSVATGVEHAWGELPGAVLSAELAARLGIAPTGELIGYLIRLPGAVSDFDVSRASLLLADYSEAWANAAIGPVAPGVLVRWGATILSFILALSVAAVAVALGEAESRADQRTLLAVGANPNIRPRIAAARAGVLAVLAGLLAIPAGLLPAWGLLSSRDTPLILPVPELAIALVLLPAAAIAGALLLSRPIPSWSVFRDVAPG